MRAQYCEIVVIKPVLGSVLTTRFFGHKTGKYAGSSYDKSEIAGEKKTASQERFEGGTAQQYRHEVNSAVPEISTCFMGMSIVFIL